MSDIQLGPDNDLLLVNGQIYLISKLEDLVRQRILNKLRSFTNTLFTNINYGINSNLVFNKGTQSLLDQEIKSMISETKGVVKLISYSSEVSSDRQYLSNFKYQIDTGVIVSVSKLRIVPDTINAPNLPYGIWFNGVWDSDGAYSDTEVWGV